MDYGYRRDGFPLCPQCGENELFSEAIVRWAIRGARDEDKPSMAEVFRLAFTCYLCNWTGYVPLAPQLVNL